jgi:hypothetical protein
MADATPKFTRRPTAPSSARDMAMLRLAPLDDFAVPRLHVEPRQVDGSLRVFDRPSGTHVLVYTPRHASHFRSGHRAGRWYVRLLTHVGGQPQSFDFGSAREAVQAVAQGGWKRDAASPPAALTGTRIRVIWPTDAMAN